MKTVVLASLLALANPPGYQVDQVDVVKDIAYEITCDDGSPIATCSDVRFTETGTAIVASDLVVGEDSLIFTCNYSDSDIRLACFEYCESFGGGLAGVDTCFIPSREDDV